MSSKRKALIILADGFEEVEAVTPIDILRRADVEVIVAGLKKDTIRGAHGVVIKTDIVFDNSAIDVDALILPGGMPGAENLAGCLGIGDIVRRMASSKKIVAAICASPALVLFPAGVLKGKKATCFPGMEKHFSSDVKFVKDDVVEDGEIITSRGAGTAAAFGIKIAERLVGREKAGMIASQMLFSGLKV
jgi:4-methyl-5(b-hydroxyethyl)-thiazole monophosphate biosynthesis